MHQLPRVPSNEEGNVYVAPIIPAAIFVLFCLFQQKKISFFHSISGLHLFRYASQNSLDESSQNKVPRPNKDKTTGSYRNNQHTAKSFDSMNEMRK